MNALTPTERQRLIDLGMISFPPKRPDTVITKSGRKSRTKPTPPKFTGTPKGRAQMAVEYARTGYYSIVECAKACGYQKNSSGLIREILEGRTNTKDLCEKANKEGGFVNGKKTSNLTLIRDYYGIEKVNGDGKEENERLRNALLLRVNDLHSISARSGSAVSSLKKFIGNEHFGMKAITRAKVWEALRGLG